LVNKESLRNIFSWQAGSIKQNFFTKDAKFLNSS